MMLLFLGSCKEKESAEDIAAGTLEATHISCRDAVLSGRINLAKSSSLSDSFKDLTYGVLYSASDEVVFGKATEVAAAEYDSDYVFSVGTKALEPETSYHYRAYIMSLSGKIKYGPVRYFRTLALGTMIKTEPATDLSAGSVVLNASLDLTDCRYSKIEYGFEVTPEGGKSITVAASNLSGKKFSLKYESVAGGVNYAFAAYVKLDGQTYRGEVETLYPTPAIVDLGLSVKWSTCNLGAATPEGYGDYYQWGGTSAVNNTGLYLDWSYCPYHISQCSAFTGWTKYIPAGRESFWEAGGNPDSKNTLDGEDDAAFVKLGGRWHTPTRSEWEELKESCTWTWTTQNGVKGYKVTSNKSGYSGRYIFLPAAGQRCYNTLIETGTNGCYWSSSLYSISPSNSNMTYFTNDVITVSYFGRYVGLPVRPVCK